MELFIRISDGQPVDHPIMGNNFREAFPEINTDSLPPEFSRFERIPKPVVDIFEVVEGPSYEWVDGIVKDVWYIRPMTAEEESQKRQDVIDSINAAVAFTKELTQHNINNAANDLARQAWVDYLAELNAWVLTDILNPNIPHPPRINLRGVVLDVTSSGSEPNVIG